MNNKIKSNICPQCGGTLSYRPNADAPFCELCGFRIDQPETQPRKNDKTEGAREDARKFFDTKYGA